MFQPCHHPDGLKQPGIDQSRQRVPRPRRKTSSTDKVQTHDRPWQRHTNSTTCGRCSFYGANIVFCDVAFRYKAKPQNQSARSPACLPPRLPPPCPARPELPFVGVVPTERRVPSLGLRRQLQRFPRTVSMKCSWKRASVRQFDTRKVAWANQRHSDANVESNKSFPTLEPSSPCSTPFSSDGSTNQVAPDAQSCLVFSGRSTKSCVYAMWPQLCAMSFQKLHTSFSWSFEHSSLPPSLPNLPPCP